MPPHSFPVKLWNILNTCPGDLMRWSDDGRQVLVNKDRFEDLTVLYPSFLRQPTLWSLRRQFAVYEFYSEDADSKQTDWIRYSHPYFVRGHPHLLEIFVLSHQTRRYNYARKAKPDSNDGKQQNEAGRCSSEKFMREFVSETDSRDDLQPICPSSLFQSTLAMCLDVDSSPPELSPLTINKHRCQQDVEYSPADCSMAIETEPPDVNDSDDTFCAQEVLTSNIETWMSQMDENEEWFGLKDQPLAVPVFSDVRQHDVVDQAALPYTYLLQLQHYNDTHYLSGNMNA